jgi:hypothetical protein
MGLSDRFSSVSLQVFILLLAVLTLAPLAQAQVSPENRPALKLISNGVRYVAPAGWRVEDEPDLSGVLFLEPAKTDAKPNDPKNWRSRILVELNERPATELSGLSLPAQAASKVISVLKPESKPKNEKQSLVEHPSGFSYGLYEAKQTRQGFEINETRLVVALPDNQRLVITASCYQTGCETFKPIYDKFLSSLALRKN